MSMLKYDPIGKDTTTIPTRRDEGWERSMSGWRQSPPGRVGIGGVLSQGNARRIISEGPKHRPGQQQLTPGSQCGERCSSLNNGGNEGVKGQKAIARRNILEEKGAVKKRGVGSRARAMRDGEDVGFPSGVILGRTERVHNLKRDRRGGRGSLGGGYRWTDSPCTISEHCRSVYRQQVSQWRERSGMRGVFCY